MTDKVIDLLKRQPTRQLLERLRVLQKESDSPETPGDRYLELFKTTIHVMDELRIRGVSQERILNAAIYGNFD